MADLQAQAILDDVRVTDRELGKGSFTQNANTLQKYVFVKHMMQQHRHLFTGGIGLQWNLMVGTSGTARATGLFATDITNQTDVMRQASVDWTHYTVSGLLSRQQLNMNKGSAQIVDRVKMANANMDIDMAKLWEQHWWANHPGSGTTNQLYGASYWIPWVTSTGAFVGGDPSGFSGGAGNLMVASAPTAQNWSATFTDLTVSDGIEKWREAATKTAFESPIDYSGYGSGADSYGYYSGYANIRKMENSLMGQNDNLGNDLASKDGLTLFRRVPVTYVPALDAKSGNPIYGINWDELSIGFLEGEYMNTTEWDWMAGAHTSLVKFKDCTLNTRCTDRRAQFVLATAAIA